MRIFLSFSLITVKKLVAACHKAWVHVGGTKYLGVLEPLGKNPWKVGVRIVLDPAETRPSPTCHCTEFDLSRSNGVGSG